MSFSIIRRATAPFELDIEPKTQTSEGDKWRNLDLTPLVEYYPAKWLDVEGEMIVGRTHQFEGVDTWEITPRLEFRFNPFGTDSNILDMKVKLFF